MEKNQAGRGGEGIEFLVVDDEKMIIKELWAGKLQGLSSKSCYIFDKVRIIKKGKFFANNGQELFANLPFLANAESLGRGRRKTSQGQIAEQKNNAEDVYGEALAVFGVIHVKYSDSMRQGICMTPAPIGAITIVMIAHLRHHLFRFSMWGRSTIAISR